MASRKPNLRLTLPEWDQVGASFQEIQNTKSSPLSPRNSQSPRSPRFREDFDAPFSEALMNASRTTFTTDISCSLLSTQSSGSVDGVHRRHTCAGRSPKAQVYSPEPFEPRKCSWTPSLMSTRRSTINDRIRKWAKKSFSFARVASDLSEDGNFGQHAWRRLSKHVVVNPPPESPNPNICASPDKYRQPIVGVTQFKSLR